METTEIYVVCNVWPGHQTLLMGAATDPDEARVIADGEAFGDGWQPWMEGGDGWYRSNPCAKAGSEPTEQAIVRVPLAGSHKLAAARVSEPWHGRPNAAGAPTADDVSRAWAGLR